MRPRSVQQRIREGFASEASWSAWLLCSPHRELNTPERRIVQLDVKQRCVVLLRKAVVKHAFQASHIAQLSRAQAVLPAGETTAAACGPDAFLHLSRLQRLRPSRSAQAMRRWWSWRLRASGRLLFCFRQSTTLHSLRAVLTAFRTALLACSDAWQTHA